MNHKENKEPANKESNMKTVQLRPQSDIFENEQSVMIVSNMTGVDKNNLEISVENQILTLQGKYISEERCGREHEMVERCYERQFQIGKNIDVEKISASIDQGVVSLTLPKVPKPEPKKISVQIN